MAKVITFDLDGVYFPNGKKNFIASLIALGVPESEVKRVFANSDQMNLQYKLGKMTDQEFWTWAASEWKLNITWQELTKLLIDSYDVDDRVVATIKKLRSQGYKTAVCSSNFPARINGLQEKFNFLDNFDIKVFSHEVGINKPDPRLYQLLVDRSQVEAKEIILTDDHLPSIEGAKSVGITTFFYENFDKYLLQLQEIGITV